MNREAQKMTPEPEILSDSGGLNLRFDFLEQ
jgi:hypothetical protein